MTPPTRYAPGIHVLAAPAGGDTIDAVADQTLRVRVVGTDSLPRTSVVVRFEGITERTMSPHWSGEYPTLLAGTVGGNSFEHELPRTTDGEGVAEARIKMGRLAGNQAMRVAVPSLGLSDTVRVLVAPGAPVGIRVLPVDTAVVLGTAYAFEAYQRDRWWNPVPGDLSREPGPGIEISGDSIWGRAFGRSKVVVQAVGLRDSMMVSVVPEATLAATQIRLGSTDFGGIAVFGSDGGGFRHLTGHSDGGFWMNYIAWAPDGDRIAFSGDGPTPSLFTVTLEGSLVQLPMTAALAGGHYVPEYSPDGEWIYFAGMPGGQSFALYRLPADGGEVERIGPEVNEYEVDSRPSVSPEGLRIAYVTNRSNQEGSHAIRVLHLPTGAIDSLDVPGDAPRWSPDGEQIAFTRDGGLHVMRPDGTYLRIITTGRDYEWLDWSPDGLWIAASGITYTAHEHGIELVRVADGLRIPLPFSQRLRVPRFQPAQHP